MSALRIKRFPDGVHREAKAGVTLQAWILEATKGKRERTKQQEKRPRPEVPPP